MDAVSLELMLRLSSRKCSLVRLVLAASVGAAYSLFDTIAIMPRIVSFLLSLAVSFVMVLICVGKGAGVKFYAKYTAVLWGAAALLAGAVTLVCTLGDGTDPVTSKGKSALFVICVGVLAVFFAVRAFVNIPRAKSADVVFSVGSYERSADALVDTGNMARDPISGCPVVFVKYDEKYDFRFSELLSGVCDAEKLNNETKKYFRVVPVRRAGQTVTLCGVICTVKCSLKETSAVLVFEKVSSYGGHEALVPPSVI